MNCICACASAGAVFTEGFLTRPAFADSAGTTGYDDYGMPACPLVLRSFGCQPQPPASSSRERRGRQACKWGESPPSFVVGPPYGEWGKNRPGSGRGQGHPGSCLHLRRTQHEALTRPLLHGSSQQPREQVTGRRASSGCGGRQGASLCLLVRLSHLPGIPGPPPAPPTGARLPPNLQRGKHKGSSNLNESSAPQNSSTVGAGVAGTPALGGVVSLAVCSRRTTC